MGKPKGLRRVNDPPLLILTSLAEGPKHGYALAQDIGEFLDLIAARFPRESLRFGKLGAIIGTHGGSEIIGVSWVDEA